MLCTLWPIYHCDQCLWCMNLCCVSMLLIIQPILVATDDCCSWHVAYECGACGVHCSIAINVLLGMDVCHVWMLSLLWPILVVSDICGIWMLYLWWPCLLRLMITHTIYLAPHLGCPNSHKQLYIYVDVYP